MTIDRVRVRAPAGTALARYMMVLGPSAWRHVDRSFRLAEAWQRYAARPWSAGAVPEDGHAGRQHIRWRVGWPLAQYGIAPEALTLMRGSRFSGKLEPQLRSTPLHVKVARETGAGTAARGSRRARRFPPENRV